MPQIKELCSSYTNYQLTNYSSQWIFLSDISTITLSFVCTNNCTLTISYSVDENYEMITQETYNIVSNTMIDIINQKVKTRYIKVEITGITIGSNLIIQGFYHV